MIKKSLSIQLLLILLLPAVMLAQGSIEGKVTDASTGDPLPGANVYIKKLNKGVATDANGNYTLESISAGTYQLTVSYVGYKNYADNVTVDGETVTKNIKLQPSSMGLNEVYVTAYGVKKSKNELSYAAQKVDGDEIAKTRPSNFIEALNGRVSGLRISSQNGMGGSSNIVLRGYKSITGNNQVLFVVDGVPYDNSIQNTSDQQTGRGGYDYGNTATDINPDNIESINVLKGPAAAALYGSRAANGAVVITTKQGEKGAGVGVTVNSSIDIGRYDPSTFAKYQHQYGAGYGPFYADQAGDNPYFFNIDMNGDGQRDLVVPFTEDASFGAKFDPKLNVYQWDAFDPSSPNYGKARPWVAAKNDPTSFFETSVTAKNSIMFDVGFDKGYFKLGYDQTNQTGILPNSSLNKHKLNFGASYDVTSRLTANADLNVALTDGKGRYGTGYDANNLMTTFRQWWETNVDLNRQRKAYFRNSDINKNVTWNWANTSANSPIFWDNPYWVRYENYETDGRDRYFGNVNLKYDVADWLNLTGRVSIDSYRQIQEERTAKGSINIPTYRRYNRNYAEYNYDLLANYNTQVSEDLSLSGVVGMNIRRNHRTSIDAQTNGGLLVPDLYALLNSANSLEAPNEMDAKLGVNGFFASANFNYKKFLILELTGRRDQSSSLPSDNNVYYYPSVSTGLVFSELMDADWLNYGKLRLNYAEVGHTAPVHSIVDTYATPTPFGSVPLFSVDSRKNNPNLKPERTRSWEAGLEMSFLNDRLGFDLTYYDENTFDQIVPAEISRATGYSQKYINAGTIENKGVELTVNSRPVVTQNFVWNLSVNWSKYQNEVTSLPEGIQNIELASLQGGVTINAAVGHPYGAIRGSDFIYKNGQPVVASSGYYEKTGTSNNIIGDMNPDWTGSISNQFQYNNWSLSFLVDMRHGGDIFSLDQWYGQGTGLYPETAALNDNGKNVRDPVSDGGGVVLPGVKEDGSPNDIHAAAYYYGYAFGWAHSPNARYVYDGSYVKLRQATISYSLPTKLINKIGIVNGVDLSLIGRNLWIIHKNLPYADPEQGLSAGNVQGYQGGAYPSTRHVVFNLRLKF